MRTDATKPLSMTYDVYKHWDMRSYFIIYSVYVSDITNTGACALILPNIGACALILLNIHACALMLPNIGACALMNVMILHNGAFTLLDNSERRRL
jgi:hypothetical protein